MIEKIIHNNKLLSIIIRVNYKSDGIEFFTPGDFSQQLGYMHRKKNHMIPPHTHNIVKREVSLTQEVIVIKSGKVRVDYYDDDRLDDIDYGNGIKRDHLYDSAWISDA